MQNTLQKLTSAALETFGMNRVEDATFQGYLQRIKGYEDALDSLENACSELFSLCETTGQSLSHSLRDMNQILENTEDNIDVWKTIAYYHYTVSVSDSLIFNEIKEKVRDEIIDLLDIKRQMLDSITDRIQICDRKNIELKSLKSVLANMEESKDENQSRIDTLLERITNLSVEVDNEKTQLKQDIELLYTYINKYILTSLNTIKDLHTYLYSSLHTSLTAPLPDIYDDPKAPLIAGKEDSEMDISVPPRDFHELPLAIRKGRCVKWTFSTGDVDIGFQVIFRKDMSQYETNNQGNNDNTEGAEVVKETVSSNIRGNRVDSDEVVVEYQRLGGDGRLVTGSYTGESKGMLLLVFDNKYSIFRYKQIHLRLSYSDIIISPSHSVLSLKEYSELSTSSKMENTSTRSINSIHSTLSDTDTITNKANTVSRSSSVSSSTETQMNPLNNDSIPINTLIGKSSDIKSIITEPASMITQLKEDSKEGWGEEEDLQL
ncbi:hypothetical protein WA158_000768 [Blastocystis sp. Blastoise]